MDTAYPNEIGSVLLHGKGYRIIVANGKVTGYAVRPDSAFGINEQEAIRVLSVIAPLCAEAQA